MGGKNKQRTKNNAKPSSSGRSAEQLSGALGALSVSPRGLAAAAGQLPPAANGLFPSLSSAPLHSDLPSEFAIAFKKLNKKDPVTKVKALSELRAAVEAGGAGAASALPAWAAAYGALALDPDRRVREAAQVCQGAVAQSCGRRVAGALRRLAPRWLLAAHDTYRPAAHHAAAALQRTFPGSKLDDMLVFCRDDIAEYLVDILTGALDDAIAKKVDDAEERAETEVRVRRGALGALGALVRAAGPGPPHRRAHIALRRALESPQYWRLADNSDAGLRASWYTCTAEVAWRCEAEGAEWAGAGAGAALGRAARALAGARPGPAAGPARLSALLLLAAHCDLWNLLDDKTRPKLQDIFIEFLENGGWGCGDVPSTLLPRVPPPLRTPDFYRAFFDAAFIGMKQKCIAESKSNRVAWLGDIVECVSVLMQGGALPAAELARAHRLAAEGALGPGPAPPHAAAEIARRTARLLQLALRRNEDGLARTFAQNLAATAIARLDSVEAEHAGEREAIVLGEAAAASVALVRELRAALDGVVPARRGVQFADDAPTAGEEPRCADDVEATAAERAAAARLGGDAAERVVGRLLEGARGAAPAAVLGPLAALVRERGAAALCGAAAADPMQWARGLLGPLLQRPDCAPAASKFALALIPHLSSDEREELFCMLEAEECSLRASVCEAEGACLCRLVCGARAPAALRPAARRALQGDRAAQALLLRCLPHAEGAECGAWGALEEAADALAETVGAAGAVVRAGAVGAVGAQLLEVGAPRAPPAPLARLLAAVLNTILRHHQAMSDDEQNSAEEEADEECRAAAVGAIRAAVRGAIQAAPPPARGAMLDAAAALLEEHSLRGEEVEVRWAEVCGAECAAVGGGRPHALLGLLPRSHIVHAVGALALLHDAVRGRYSCPAPGADSPLLGALRVPADPDAAGGVPRALQAALVRALALRAALCPATAAAADCADGAPPLPAEDAVLEAVAEVLHDCAAVAAAAEAYPYARCGEQLRRAERALRAAGAALVGAVEGRGDAGARLGALVGAAAAAGGAYWAAATLLLPRPAPAPPTGDTADGFFHALQARTRWEWDLDATSDDDYAIMFAATARAWVTAHGARPGAGDAARRLLGAAGDAAHGGPPPDIDALADACYRHRDTLPSPETDLSELEWTEATSACQVAAVLGAAAGRGALSAAHWDLACLTAAALLQAAAATARWDAPPAAAVALAALRLYASLARAAHAAGNDRDAEFRDVFAPELERHTRGLLERVLQTAAGESGGEMTAPRALVAEALRRAAAAGRVCRTAPLGLAALAADALARPAHLAFLYLAQQTLFALDDALAAEDESRLSQWGEAARRGGEGAGALRLYAHELLPPLERALHRLEPLLQPFKIGEEVWVGAAESAEHEVAVGALALGGALLRAAAARSGDLAHHYAALLRDGHASRLLEAALRTLPLAALDSSPAITERFVRDPALGAFARRGELLDAVTCRCVYLAASGPAVGALRDWLGAAPPRAARLLRRLVEDHCSAALVREQLAAAAALGAELPDVEVTVCAGAREARAALEGEGEGEGGGAAVRVWLPEDFPLSPARAAGARAQAVAVYLSGGGRGGLRAALSLWAGAVRAGGRPAACYVCYCRLHPVSGALPAVPCYQCNNSFHNECLRQWFLSSNRANCPLCRANF